MTEVTAGARLGPYEIVSRIGAGGMGEVWRARDVRLDRAVAVKLLSSELAPTPQLRQRFEREARAISQLNHPHICTLHDVGEENGTSYLVMELLEGETLADRIVRGPLPLADVVRFGAQIAGALDRAHRAGIVHRDLKPGNVMITKSGAKLLDFGLAKASAPVVVDDGPTLQKSLTAEGTIVGTFQYMAPEQLEGLELDARTDIFALGAVLYEMVTGRRAFDGRTRTSLIAAIVGSEPAPIRETQPLTPAALEHVIATCLEKDPERRWQSAADVARELEWIAAGSAIDPAPARRSRKHLGAIVIASLAVLAAAATAMYVRERSKPVTPIAFSILAPHGFTVRASAISPDGQSIAFTAEDVNGGRVLWVRRLGDLNAVRLATDTARHSRPLWSPDSKWIAFTAAGEILKVPAGGGRQESLLRYPAAYFFGATWSPSGDIVFSPRAGRALFRLRPGGEAVPLTTLDKTRGEIIHGWPCFLPDGDHFLYLVHTRGEERNELYAGALSAALKKFVVKADSLVGYWNGRLLFAKDGTIYAQPFDARSLALSGDPRAVVDDVYFDENWASSFATVSSDGAIAYLPASAAAVKHEIAWYGEDGHKLQKVLDDTAVQNVEISPDDSKLAIMKLDPRKGASEIYSYDIARGIATRITGGLSNNESPRWSPDGSRLFYDSERAGMYDVYSQLDDGASPASVLWKSSADKRPNDVSRDGRFVLTAVDSVTTKYDIWVTALPAGQPRPLIASDAWDDHGRFSPDGRWFSYASDRSGRFEVYVAAFPDGRSYQVSTEGGSLAQWDFDGSRIFFEGPDRAIYAVAVHLGGAAPSFDKPLLQFARPSSMTGWWRSKTSKRFLCRTIVDPRETAGVIDYVKGWDDSAK
jgi:serine/threonine protein kinase